MAQPNSRAVEHVRTVYGVCVCVEQIHIHSNIILEELTGAQI